MFKQVLQKILDGKSSSKTFITCNTLLRRLGDERRGSACEEQPISTDSSEIQKKRQRIKNELEYFRLLNNNLPQHVLHYQWQALLNLPTESQRKSYYADMAKIEAKTSRKTEKIHKTVRKQVTVETCQRNSLMFLDGSEQFSADTPNKESSLWRDRVHGVHKHRGAQSFLHGSPIVLDADFPMDFGTEQMATNHVRFCNKMNLHQKDPMHLFVTGLKDKKWLKDRLNFLSDDFYLDSFNESFIELADRRQLVYLLPTGPPMPYFNPDAIYVIQLINHYYRMPPTALWKAKQLGITFHSLPFNRYPSLVNSRFIPSVPLLFRMMLDLHLNKDFEKAFKTIGQPLRFF